MTVQRRVKDLDDDGVRLHVLGAPCGFLHWDEKQGKAVACSNPKKTRCRRLVGGGRSTPTAFAYCSRHTALSARKVGAAELAKRGIKE